MSTHAIARQGPASATAATKLQIGADIIMPADGPWTIFGIWGQVVKATAVAAEGTGGLLILDSLSGDIDPDPAPAKWPVVGNMAGASANFAGAQVPLNIWPVNWSASGKATLKLSFTNLLASATAPEVACGIIFGKEIPERKSMLFCDSVSAAFAAATEQSIGTITLAEKATRIVGILADLQKGDAHTVAEEVMATIRLDSADIKFPPAQFPCCRAYDSGDGTVAGAASVPQSQFIPVDIPIVGGARIDVFATSSIAVTANCEVTVSIAYE